MKSRTTNEFLVMHLSDMTNSTGLTNKSCKIWNPTVLKQLGTKLAMAKETKEYRNGRAVKVEAHFQNGSTATFLFLPDDLSTFETHEAIRENFHESVKASSNVSFNVQKLSEDEQRIAVDALTSLAVLSDWEPPFYGKKTEKKRKKKKAYGFYSDLDGETISRIMSEAELKAAATNEVRTLAMTPGNIMTSKVLVTHALKSARKLGLEFKFLNVDSLKEMGAGAFLAVVQGSESDGGIVTIRRPVEGGLKVTLVGKGVVFDTGGHDLKTDSSMLGMHRDMTGAAVALSTFKALVQDEQMAELDLTVYLAVGENMISPAAYKPGDVIKALSGETIEIENTDAEGRLLLADTLTLASKDKPDLIIDFATLTGSALDVLGDGYSVAMSNDEDLLADIQLAGRSSGERVWPLPMNEEFEEEVINSEVADLGQATGYSHAEHSYAAAFLTHFVPNSTQHVHVDLACEKKGGGLGLVESDINGFGVRWTFEFLKAYKEQ